MDFITGLPRTLHGYNSIWVIVDRLTKSAHFLPVKATYPIEKYAELYHTKIVCLHGVPKTIISDRGPQFTAHFWESLDNAMGTTLTFSTAYHPQTGGQTERVNQILEDILRACTIIYGKDWETCLPFADFFYNNSFQASIGMSPFEALYGRSCRTPLNWSESGERRYFGPEIVNYAEEKVRTIQERLQTAQGRQKRYADRQHQELNFQVGDYGYLKVSPFKGTQRFEEKGKLAPLYVGPFRIVARRGAVAYQLELPQSLSSLHNVFHVSQLKKCFKETNPNDWAVNIDDINLQSNLSYKEHPIRTLDQAERKTRNKVTKFVKVQWSRHSVREATWEQEDQLWKHNPNLFLDEYVYS
jgi:hypothetical protein